MLVTAALVFAALLLRDLNVITSEAHVVEVLEPLEVGDNNPPALQ